MTTSTLSRSSTHQEAIEQLRQRLNLALRGKSDVVEMVLICLLSNGHLLLEDKPGLGKTTLAKALAAGIGGRFARAQCTPDLLPGDITDSVSSIRRLMSLNFVKARVCRCSAG